jgi:outer membrane protein TolC
MAAVAETQLRVLMSAPAERKLEVGIDVFAEPARPRATNVETLLASAMKKRLELRALEESHVSAKAAESVARAGYFPRVDAFGNVQYANPNQRAILPQPGWLMTWDAGVRATWVINETFSSIGAVAEAKARVAAVDAQRAALRNAIRLEVERAAADVRKSTATIESADRGLTSAEESLRVRRELFMVGRASAVDLVDAETELTRARLARLNARIAAMVAATRLEHAVGNDVK